jgi:hypothetical protein
LKSKYAPDFAAAFKQLPTDTQEKFKEIDAQVAAGDLSSFSRQGWAFIIDLDDEWSAMGSHREEEGVFYWMLLGSGSKLPIIL